MDIYYSRGVFLVDTHCYREVSLMDSRYCRRV
jgi:hypothetical protein